MPTRRDPYEVLGVSPSATDAEVRVAYRRLVKLHHPDHNNGSEESEERFEEVQDAYARVVEMRRRATGTGTRTGTGTGTRSDATPDPDLDARMADLERELRQANEARERARRAAREAAAAGADPEDLRQRFKRATDEELGYVRTDDSFSKILADVRDEVSGRLADAREKPVGQRVSDLIDELEQVVSKAARRPRD